MQEKTLNLHIYKFSHDKYCIRNATQDFLCAADVDAEQPSDVMRAFF